MSKGLVLAFAALTLLGACGVSGGLDRPPPMWNKERAEAADARRQAEFCSRQIQTSTQRRHCTTQAASGASTITSTTILPTPLPSSNAPPGSATSPSENH